MAVNEIGSKIESYVESLDKSIMTRALAAQIRLLQSRYPGEYEEAAGRTLDMIDALGYDATAISYRYIMDYVTELDYFLTHGEYGHDDYDAIRASIYDDADVMHDTYMPGLLISYICTCFLYEKYHFYLKEFLPRLSDASQGIEAGFGDGFYLWNLWHAHKGAFIKGYDISPHAVEFTTRLFHAAGVPEKQYALKEGNLIEGLPEMDNSQDYFILAEVIEHLPEPDVGFREMARVLKPGGVFYLTTVLNSNHMDHMVNFKEASAVEAYFAPHGLAVEKKLEYRIRDDFPKSKDMGVGLAYVGKKIG